MLDPIDFTLVPVKTESVTPLHKGLIPVFKKQMNVKSKTPSTPPISLYLGDNLGILAGLGAKYDNKVDAIFIDPPYNTGKQRYSYKDRAHAKTVNSHRAWLSMIAPRLILAKNLLRDTGVILVAIGMDEQAHLKVLMDNIYGENNFIAMITMPGMLKNNVPFISTGNEYWLVYAKDTEALKQHKIKWRTQKKAVQLLLNKAHEFMETSNGNPRLAEIKLREFYATPAAKVLFEKEPGLKMYNKVDDTGRVYRSSDLSSPSGNGGRYKIVNPLTGQEVAVPTRGWVHNKETFHKLIDSGVILWNDAKTPSFKRYLDENTKVVKSDIGSPSRINPSKLLQKMIGRSKFTFPKDHISIAEWLDYVIPQFRKDDLVDPPVVVDFFAGSGSTAHAVAELNHHQGLSCETILVTSKENDIPFEVTIPRLKAMVTGKWFAGKTEALPGDFTVYDVEYQDPSTVKTVGLKGVSKRQVLSHMKKVPQTLEGFLHSF